jgi:cytochrome c oxidase subunit 3/cytochrome o ubiquinol oxidase subunit 3
VQATSSTTEGLVWKLPSAGKVGISCLIVAETAIFVIFVVAYAFNIGKSLGGPTPQILRPPILLSVCLLSSSATIVWAIRSLERNAVLAFTGWWFLTLALGAVFLAGTGLEWHRLITHEGLTISTNLFGTTFYSLVGLHAAHVTIGLLVMTIVAVFAALRKVTREHSSKLEVFSLYWHFVDAVWVVVFTLVYVVGR